MVIDYGKKDVVPLSEHFDSVAFNCPCNDPGCNHTLVDSDLVEDLEKLYALVGEIWVSSGFRCQRHNRLVGGKPGSLHLVGKAADIQSPAVKPATVSEIAEAHIPRFKSGGIGLAKNFVHLDVRGYRSRWTY